MGYTKLFNDLVFSTVWREPDHIRLVWITMLALKDERDMVMASVPGLADAAKVTIAQCEEALHKLMSPDPYSRTKFKEGRRIEEQKGGWFIINAADHRNRMSHEEQKAYQRYYKENQRLKEKLEKVLSMSVHVCPSDSTMSENVNLVHTTEQNITEHNNNNICALPSGKSTYSQEFLEFYEKYPVKKNKKAAFKSWQKLKPDEALKKEIFAGLDRAIGSDEWKEEKYIPHPSTFLNGERWNDTFTEDWQTKFIRETS